MAERRQAWVHLARGLEELLRGAAELAASVRERAESREHEAAREPVDEQDPADPVTLQAAGDLLDAFAEGAAGGLEVLRVALEEELERWQEPAVHDPAARRVRDLFASLLAVLDVEPGPEVRPTPRRGPRRGAGRTPRTSRRAD